jgi:hypothetical protein
MQSKVIIGLGLFTVMGCTETPDTRVRNENQALATTTPSDDEEKVDQPHNITGSYLYCQPLLDQNEGQMVHKAGCRITDAQNGSKVPVESLAQKTEWTFRPAPQSNITAEIAIGQPQDAYHAIYTFRLPAGQSPNLGDGSGAVVATVFGVTGRSEPVVFTASLDALVIEVIDARMLDVFERLIR